MEDVKRANLQLVVTIYTELDTNIPKEFKTLDTQPFIFDISSTFNPPKNWPLFCIEANAGSDDTKG